MKKYLDNKFIMGTIILLTGGFFSKFLGFILKIIVTRMIGINQSKIAILTICSTIFDNIYIPILCLPQ